MRAARTACGPVAPGAPARNSSLHVGIHTPQASLPRVDGLGRVVLEAFGLVAERGCHRDAWVAAEIRCTVARERAAYNRGVTAARSAEATLPGRRHPMGPGSHRSRTATTGSLPDLR